MWYCAAGAPAFWWIFPLIFGLFWIGIIALFVFRARFWWHGGGRHWNGGASASSVLRERFARGEIDVDEYQRRLRVLDNQ